MLPATKDDHHTSPGRASSMAVAAPATRAPRWRRRGGSGSKYA